MVLQRCLSLPLPHVEILFFSAGRRTVFVANLPWDIAEHKVANDFATAGDVLRVEATWPHLWCAPCLPAVLPSRFALRASKVCQKTHQSTATIRYGDPGVAASVVSEWHRGTIRIIAVVELLLTTHVEVKESHWSSLLLSVCSYGATPSFLGTVSRGSAASKMLFAWRSLPHISVLWPNNCTSPRSCVVLAVVAVVAVVVVVAIVVVAVAAALVAVLADVFLVLVLVLAFVCFLVLVFLCVLVVLALGSSNLPVVGPFRLIA